MHSSTSTGIHSDTGADTVLLPVRIHSKTCWYRAWNHRANTYILCLLWSGILRASSYKNMQKSSIRRWRRAVKSIPCKHRMERNRKTYLHQRYSWYHRCDLKRSYLKCTYKENPILQLFEVPTELTGVDTGILDPRDTYADVSEWETKAKDLADRFIKNFAKYEGNDAGKALVAAGPQK